MNYIELLGLPTTGKTFYKKNIQKKKNFMNMRYLLIKFFSTINKLNFNNFIKIYILLLLNSKFVQNYKNKNKSGNIIFKNNDKIIFNSTKRSIFLKFVDYLNLNKFYLEIINHLSTYFKIKNDKLMKILLNEIQGLNQNKEFKIKLKNCIIENFLIIKILKEYKDWNCIVDEGLLYRIYLIFSLTNNKDYFIKRVLKNYSQYGKIIILDSKIKKIISRSNLRKKNYTGYIYKNSLEIYKEFFFFNIFLQKIQKKIIFKKIKTEYFGVGLLLVSLCI